MKKILLNKKNKKYSYIYKLFDIIKTKNLNTFINKYLFK